jgi:hypothetical protein
MSKQALSGSQKMKHQSDSEVLLYQTDDDTTRVEVRMAS